MLQTLKVCLSPSKALLSQNPPTRAGHSHSSRLYLKHLYLFFIFFFISSGKAEEGYVLSFSAPLPIHPPRLPSSVICRPGGNLNDSLLLTKISLPTESFYICTPAPSFPPLSFLFVVVSCDLLSTPIRQFRWKTRGEKETLTSSSSSLSFPECTERN